MSCYMRAGLRERQRGATLIIALVLLVVLTLLGLQGMRSNLTQERMAGNMTERHLAFQAAEAALRLGEALRPFPENGTSLPNAQAWDGDTPPPNGTFEKFDPKLAWDPAFHIGGPQYIFFDLDVGSGSRVGSEPLRIYPVTAVGFGAQPTSIVVIQSWLNPD